MEQEAAPQIKETSRMISEESIPTTRPEIVLHIYKKEIEEKERIEVYNKYVADPVIEFLKAHIEEINNVQGIADLVAHPRNSLKIKNMMLEEFEDNVKTPQNLAGPIGNWTSVVPKKVHDFLLYYQFYYLYTEQFLLLPHMYPDLQEIFDKANAKLNESVERVILRFVRSPLSFSRRLQALRAATEKTHADFKKLSDLIDIINYGMSMIEAATADGSPPKIADFTLAKSSRTYPYGTLVEVTAGAKEPMYGLVISKISSNSQKNDKQIKAEIEANQTTKNRNVLKMLSFQEDELFWYLFWPDTTGRTLADVIEKQTYLIEEAARPIFRQMMQGLRHVHSSGICKNNISPNNIVFYKNTVRISNFSSCRFTTKDACDETYFVKSPYASPESFSKKPYNGMLSDIWTCGIILYEMLAGKPPFNANTEKSLAYKVRRGNAIYPKSFSSQVITLLKGILCAVPSERMTVEQILSHPWMLKIEEVPISNLLSVALGI